jgi:hypothetical protein
MHAFSKLMAHALLRGPPPPGDITYAISFELVLHQGWGAQVAGVTVLQVSAGSGGLIQQRDDRCTQHVDLALQLRRQSNPSEAGSAAAQDNSSPRHE